MLLLGPLAALVGAMAWALVWIGYDKVFELLKTNVLHVPRIVVLLVMTGIGALIGGPVGLVLKHIPRRGRGLSMMVAAGCAVGGVLLGELLYATWLVYRITNVLDLSMGAQVLPTLWRETGALQALAKLMAGGAGVWVAIAMARPPKPKLDL